MSLRVVDLFCGGGGSSAGARFAGAEIIRGVDAWSIAAKTYSDNFGEGTGLETTLRPGSGPSVLGEVGSIDLLLASPECTNHTCARGNRERDEASQRTANYVINFAKVLQPRWVVVENVVHMRSWCGYQKLLKELGKLYLVTEQVIDAEHFAVPQSRKRLFLMCDRERKPPKVERSRARVHTAEEVLDRSGTHETRPLYTDRRAQPTLDRAERGIKALGRRVPFLIVYYGTDGAGGWQPLDKPLRTITTLDRFALVEWEGNEPMMRMLQPRELQRAMGFPASFKLQHGTRRDMIRLLGNAVCPPVMKAIVESTVAGAIRRCDRKPVRLSLPLA